jgi:hypothetical protein
MDKMVTQMEQWNCMFSSNNIIELNIGIQPEVGVSGGMLIETEQSTFLTFNAKRSNKQIEVNGMLILKDAGIALFEFQRCLLTRFGYPNDEARFGIPRYKGVGYGIYEVQNSAWIKEVVRMNRYQFPKTTDDYVSKHYLFAFHDSTFECLADNFKYEFLTEPLEIILKRITDRLLHK